MLFQRVQICEDRSLGTYSKLKPIKGIEGLIIIIIKIIIIINKKIAVPQKFTRTFVA
jgi:hypothetical protein